MKSNVKMGRRIVEAGHGWHITCNFRRQETTSSFNYFHPIFSFEEHVCLSLATECKATLGYTAKSKNEKG